MYTILRKYLPLICWCLVIFMLSSRPKTINIGPNYWTDFAAKKVAHLVEYAILALFSYRAFNKNNWISLFFVFLYGLSDEFHQSFIPGREPHLRDVFIDLGGGVLGLWIIKFLPPKVQRKLVV